MRAQLERDTQRTTEQLFRAKKEDAYAALQQLHADAAPHIHFSLCWYASTGPDVHIPGISVSVMAFAVACTISASSGSRPAAVLVAPPQDLVEVNALASISNPCFELQVLHIRNQMDTTPSITANNARIAGAERG